MNWFFIALIAPFLWSFVNILDQHLVDKYSLGERRSGGLVIFSSIVSLFFATGIIIFNPGVFEIPNLDKILLLIVGMMTVVWFVLYLYTLEIEKISSVAPWFLTVPIFGYPMAHILLGETLTKNQQIGSLIVIFGIILISLNFKDKRVTLPNWKPILYIVCACIVIAISGVIFKFVTIEGNFWISSYWEYLGLGLMGLMLYLFLPKYRYEFTHMSKVGGSNIVILNIITETMTIAGNLISNFALLMAPVSMVYLVGSFQPAIVLIFATIGTKYFPKFVNEDVSKKVLISKIVAIAIMILGSMLLFI